MHKTTFKGLLIASLLLAGTAQAAAEEITVDGLCYNYEAGWDVVTVAHSDTYTGDITVPATISYEGQTLSVTTIGSGAFARTGVTSVTISEGVQYIDIEAFMLCESLTSISIPGSVTFIGSNAFYRCTSLPSVTLPSSVTSMGDGVFGSCVGLTTVVCEDGLRALGSNTFSMCMSLTSVTLPNSLTYISTGVFSSCTSLESVSIPASIKSVAYDAFSGCHRLTAIEVDDANEYFCSVDGALLNKAQTELRTVPGGKETYTVPATVTAIGDYACFYCEKLTSIALPPSLETIGYAAFEYCSALTSVDLPKSLRTVKGSAFSACRALEAVSLPDGLTTIDDNAFGFCEKITEIQLPASLTLLGRGCFMGCAIKTVSVLAENPETIELKNWYGDAATDYFDSDVLEQATLNVPVGAAEAYKTAPVWQDFQNIVENPDLTGIGGVEAEAAPATATDYYDASGRRLSTPRHGVNLIRYSDGTVCKQLMK